MGKTASARASGAKTHFCGDCSSAYMKQLLFVARLCAAVGCALTPSFASQAPSTPAVEWWEIDRDVAEQLFERDVGAWARALEAEPLPADASRLLERFAFAYRAGHDAWARAIIDALAAQDSKPPVSDLSAAVDRVIDREHWELARYFLERLPRAEPGWGYVFVRHWSESAEAEAVDAWLAARAQSNRDYWFRERLRFRSDRGTAAPLIAELAAAVRAHPSELAPALDYLEAARSVGGAKNDPAWLGETCRPRLAFDSYQFGATLAAGWPRAAIALLDRSLATPFTDEDRAAFARIPMQMALPSDAAVEQLVRAWTRHALLQACKSAGDSQRAQQLLEELAATSDVDQRLPVHPRVAGEIQADSGGRAIERRILSAEAKREDDYEYWLERADYFGGREQRVDAVAAFERALQLAEGRSEAGTSKSGRPAFARTHVLGRYAAYLLRANDRAACRALLWREFAGADLASEHAAAIVRHLYDEARAASEPDAAGDERWWRYLAARAQWADTEERLLMHLSEATPAGSEARETLWTRATTIASADPTRALVLGWVMTRNAADARAIPLLADAEKHAADEEQRTRAGFTLFEAYLAVGDWQSAELVWPSARRQLTPQELSQWFGKIAIAAARAGAADDALRVWRQRTNLDRAELHGLDDMLHAGLREPLIAFYAQLAREDPASSAPARALARLRETR